MRFIIISLILVIPQILFATEKIDDDTLRVYHLGEVYVTAKRITDLPATVVEVSREDIQAKNAENLSEAITDISGIFVSTGGKNSSEVRIRGSASEDVLIMIDGRTINETYYGKLDLDMVPSDNIQRIKVVKGPASVLYGPNVKGGVVNILTVMPDKPQFNLHTLVGQNNTYKTSISAGMPIGDFSYRLSYSKNESDGYTTPNSDNPVKYSEYDKQDITGKIVYNGFADTKLGVSAGYYTAEKGIPIRYWKFTNWERKNFDASATHNLNRNITLKAKLYGDSYLNDLLMDEIQIDDVWGRELSRHDNWTLGANFNGQWQSDTNNFDGLVMLRKEIFNRQTLEPVKVDAEEFTSTTTTISAQDEYQLFSNMDVTTGLMYSVMSTKDAQKAKISINPYAGINYRPISNLAIKYAFSKTTKFPTLHNMYSSGSGNPDLKDEKVYKHELSMDYAPISRLALNFAVFRSDITDLIWRRSKGWRYSNKGDVYNQGLEVGIKIKPIKNLSVDVDYSRLKSWDEKNDVSLDLVPEHKWNLRFGYETSIGTKLNFSYMYIGKRYNEGLWLEPYTVLNAKIKQTFLKNWDGFISVENLADTEYEEEKDWLQAGRTITGGINWAWEGF